MMEIQLKNVKKAFATPLIDLESFAFETGKIHGIIGHNGIGKTTLLRILAGLEPVDSGHVTYGGNPYSATVAKQLSYVYQKPYMLNKNVYENIAFPLKLRKYPLAEVEQMVEEWLNVLNINHLKNRKARVLSGGEQQKVALARGLIYKPDLVLLDEPTSNIDPKTLQVLEGEIKKYQRRTNATVIMVSHCFSQVSRLCDAVYILDQGCLNPVSKEQLLQEINYVKEHAHILSYDYEMIGV